MLRAVAPELRGQASVGVRVILLDGDYASEGHMLLLCLALAAAFFAGVVTHSWRPASTLPLYC